MLRTTVGYAGGSTRDPHYHDLADHTEALEIEYDPARIGYDELLDVFFAEHRPIHPPYSRQYRSAVFVADEAQRRAADARIDALELHWGVEIQTAVEGPVPFWRAEDYHQKYSLRRHAAVVEKLALAFGEDWTDSTLAARLNAVAGGYGKREQLVPELRRLGVDESQIESFEGALATCGLR